MSAGAPRLSSLLVSALCGLALAPIACSDPRGDAAAPELLPLESSQRIALADDPGHLLARAPELTGHFELRIRPGTEGLRRHLSEGWSEPERDELRSWIWSSGPASNVRFELGEPLPLVLRFRCFPLDVPGGRPQRVHVSINSAFLDTRDLRPGEAEYEVPLPAAALQAGENRIQFRYDWIEVPARVIPGSDDARELAVAFTEIAVSSGMQSPRVMAIGAGSRVGVLLEDPGELAYLSWPPAGSELEVGWMALAAGGSPAAETAFQIALEWDAGRRVLREGRVRRVGVPGSARIPLSPEAGHAVRLRFSVSDLPPGARWVWIDPRIRAPEIESGPAASVPTRTAPGTNLLFVLLDAATRDRFGLYGSPNGNTPHIDELAKESLVFDAVISQASYTLASVASIFTSGLPAEHQLLEERDRLAPEWQTLAETLREAGYATATFSGNPYISPILGLDQGFEHRVELFRGHPPGEVARADDFHQPIGEWLRANRSRPFFAYVHYVQPHEPYNAAPREFYGDLDPGYAGPCDGSQERMRAVFRGVLHPGDADITHIRKLYEGNLRYADRAVGRLVELLRELDLLERTILVVTADHGESLGERGTFGHGHTVDPELIQLPLLIRLPGELGRRGREDGLVAAIDLMPTLLETLGVPPPNEVRGRNVLSGPLDAARGWPRSLVSVAGGRIGTLSVIVPGFKYSYDAPSRRERLMRLPGQEDTENVRWEHPVTFAYLVAEARRLRPAASVQSGPTGDIPAETREALRALGYVAD